MILNSPQKFEVPKDKFGLSCIVTSNNIIRQDDFDVPVDCDFLYYGEALKITTDTKGDFESAIPISTEIRNETILDIMKFQIKVNTCITLGEQVNRKLEQLISLVTSPGISGHIERDYVYEMEVPVEKLDFMKLKEQFSKLIKSSSLIQSVERFNTGTKRRGITRPFNQFVLDRNTYTHGKLILSVPTNDFLLQIKDRQEGKAQYLIVTQTELQSFVNVANVLKQILSDVTDLYTKSPLFNPI